MVFDIAEIFVAEPFGGIALYQFTDNRLGLDGEMTGVSQFAAADVVVEGIDVFIEKGRLSHQHFEQNAADPVNV